MKKTISVAAPSARPFILDEKHFTTLGFNHLVPVYSREVLPGDKFSITPDVLARAAVPNLPNMGDINLNLRCFYVPFAQVFTPFNDFINGIPHPTNNGTLFQNVTQVPVITQSIFGQLFTDVSTSGPGFTTSTPSSGTPDIVIKLTSGSTVFHKRTLTRHGKRALQVFQALGYNFNFDRDVNFNLSSLPLLCFFKAYVDYYVPSRFQQSHPLHLIIRSIANSSQPALTFNDIKSLFDNFFLYADHNYFTNSWLTPNAPAPNLNNFGAVGANAFNFEFSDPSSLSDDQKDVRGLSQNSSSFVELLSTKVTDVGISVLQKFSNFIRRNNFSGSRAIERLLARFGVHAPEQIMDMCQYVGSMSVSVQNIEITSTAATDGANVGDYSGMQYAISSDKDKTTFSVDVQRHGMIIIFASLGVPSMFVDGVRRSLLHISPTSFYTPEFDGTLLQAINSSEYLGRMSLKSAEDAQYLSDIHLNENRTQGFTERYAEYKMAVDSVTGDFNVPTLSQTIDPFILPRRIFDTNGYLLSTGSDNLGQFNYFGSTASNPFTPQNAMTQSDSMQFNRIFRDLFGFADPYYLKFSFSVRASRRMLNSDESAELLGYGEKKKFDSTGTNFN